MSSPPPPGDAPPESEVLELPETSRPRRRWQLPTAPVLAALVALQLVTASLAAAVRTGQGGGTALAASAEGTISEPVPPDTTTTTVAPPVQPAVSAPTTVPAAPPRTKPTPPPRDERAPSPLVKVGEIRIPKIGLVHAVYEGITLTVLDHGPGHWPGSAMPGQLGNSVFAGHRVSHSHPFRDVDELGPGDEIIFTTDAGISTYRVTRQEIVNPTDVWIVDPTEAATLTIFACHPPGSARQRIVVRGEFVSTAPA